MTDAETICKIVNKWSGELRPHVGTEEARNIAAKCVGELGPAADKFCRMLMVLCQCQRLTIDVEVWQYTVTIRVDGLTITGRAEVLEKALKTLTRRAKD